MKQPRLNLYLIDMKYIRNLAHIDDHVFSVSPQTGKSSRPFLGVIVICEDHKYCVPLSSPKKKHQTMKNDIDFTKVFDKKGKLIGVLNFNNMVPVRDDVITRLDLKISSQDNAEVRHYKNMTRDQLTFCQKNQDAIVKKANKLYRLVTSGSANGFVKRRCCKYKTLEVALDNYK